MKIPTVKVRRKTDGHLCVINESDYDHRLHTLMVDGPVTSTSLSSETASAMSMPSNVTTTEMPMEPEPKKVTPKKKVK